MITDPFKQVSPGDPLQISATAWNAIMDSVRSSRGVDLAGRNRSPQITPCTIVAGWNNTGGARVAGDAVGIDLVDNGDGSTAPSLGTTWKIKAASCNATTHAGRVAVCLESIASGAVGRMCIAGTCLAKVAYTASSSAIGKYLSAMTAVTLQAADTGDVGRVLWEATTDATRTALIELGPVGIKQVSSSNDTVGYATGGTQQTDAYTASSATKGLVLKLQGYPYFDGSDGYWKARMREAVFSLFQLPDGTKFWGMTSLPAEGSLVSLVDFDPCGT